MKIMMKKQFFGYHDALEIYGAPKLSTEYVGKRPSERGQRNHLQLHLILVLYELGRVADENLNKILNDNIDVSFNFNLSLTNVLEQCRNDKTIYTILQLDQAFDLTSEIENWQENFGIDKIIEDIKKQVDETLDDITNNIDISTFETQVDELSEILSEMIGYINDEIIKLNVNDVFDISQLDGIVDQVYNISPELSIKVQDIINEFNNFTETFDNEKDKFKNYLENDLYYGVSLSSYNSYLS